MTIAEIESTLRTLCIRHPNLDDELLVTLLTAGGWEDKVIKDAVSIFKNSPGTYKSIKTEAVLSIQKVETEKVQVPEKIEIKHAPQVVSDFAVTQVTKIVPQGGIVPLNDNVAIKNEDTSKIVYFDTEGKEEEPLPTLIVPDVLLERKETPVLHPVREALPIVEQKIEKIPALDIQEKIEIPKITADLVKPPVEKYSEIEIPLEKVSEKPKENIIEPQSLIVPNISNKIVVQKVDPPENLPLKPFESTPHVWPFSKYKEVFHGEIMPPLPVEERALVNGTLPPKEYSSNREHISKKIKIKRTGFDGEDEGLIFLTGSTLLIILLLLAYMYSNGRL